MSTGNRDHQSGRGNTEPVLPIGFPIICGKCNVVGCINKAAENCYYCNACKSEYTTYYTICKEDGCYLALKKGLTYCDNHIPKKDDPMVYKKDKVLEKPLVTPLANGVLPGEFKRKTTREKSSRNWAFTQFHLEPEDTEWLDDERIRYYKYGLEICPKTKKEHMQGWVQLELAQTMTWMKSQMDEKNHWSLIRGSSTDNEIYCSKEGIIYEKGTFEEFGRTQGQRSDLDQIIEEIKMGTFDKNNKAYLKYGKNIDSLIYHNKQQKAFNAGKEYFFTKIPSLTENQEYWKSLIDKLQDGQVLWIVDEKKGGGAIGKSAFVDWMKYKHDSITFENGKSADIAMSYEYQPYVMFDFVRSNEDHINYGVIESLLNGRIMSPKYQSVTKYFKPPKVAVFSNFRPNVETMSDSRWHILTYDENEELINEEIPPKRDAKINKKLAIKTMKKEEGMVIGLDDILENDIFGPH